jgi:hypothetical protein
MYNLIEFNLVKAYLMPTKSSVIGMTNTQEIVTIDIKVAVSTQAQLILNREALYE